MSTNDSLEKIFVTAALISRSALRAETAMMSAIRTLRCENSAQKGLFKKTLELSLELDKSSGPVDAEEIERTLAMLPSELGNVADLPVRLRQAFVLRILAGLPREYCANLLHIDIAELDQRTGLAAQALAGPQLVHPIAPAVIAQKAARGLAIS